MLLLEAEIESGELLAFLLDRVPTEENDYSHQSIPRQLDNHIGRDEDFP
jgi:hypothetical protein